ncbi:helix-turn-helix domain-containing protein [Deminuibacter soli]|uniref:Helix-turn-helix domain-containing protein n=1 Tax=Deminuibacter soli TaxID=2291815 RepID=A0A3E1NEY5_9BACT|nr:helix-turn-helix domain-containing protein [Deminuibacter soli]RFM26530.1 helix-turn-helix domain-containing protein [Deminuibacter soli]
MQFLSDKEKRAIPHFSLSESSEAGHALFEIKEVDGHTAKKKPHVFIPHRKDYYFFFLVKDGYNRHWVDFVSYETKPGNLYFTVPHQVHLKEKTTPVSGLFLAFTEEFLALQDRHELRDLPILLNPDNRHELVLSELENVFLNDLMMHMLCEFKTNHDWKSSMLQSYLNILLVYVSRVYTRSNSAANSLAGSRQMVNRMKTLVNEQFHELHQASDYAQLLHVSPGHLNDTIKAYTGRTATSLIQERLIVEAKRLLFHGDLQVKEIAYQLGFEDAAYFNRFFKKLTGETPASFRLHSRDREKYNLYRS